MNIYIGCVLLGFLLDKIAIFPFVIGLVVGIFLSTIVTSENNLESLRDRMYVIYSDSMHSYQKMNGSSAGKPE